MDCHEYTLDIDDIRLHSEQCEANPSTQICYELTLDGIVVGKGTLGFRGNGIKSVSSTPSTEDEGENVVTVLTDDGQTFTFKVRNGSRGNGIASIDVVQSSADAGANKVTVNFTDGFSETFDVYNGHTGVPAGFGIPTISIDDTYGTPTASVTATGPDTAKVFHLDLKHLKGNGIESMDFSPSSADGGTNTVVFNLSDGTKRTIQVLNGTKGSKGDTGDPFSVAKVYSSIAEMNAGYATDGVKVGGFVVIDTGNVEDEDNAKLFVKGNAQYDYLTDMSGAQGIQGPRGTGISSIEQTTTSTSSEGVNEATIALTDGTSYKISYRNGAKGDKGTSISKVEQTTKSTSDSGTNVMKVYLDDGTSSEFEVRNGSKGSTGDTGNGISNVSVNESSADGGSNVVTMAFTDGTSKTFNVKNGSKGSTGTAAGFGTPTATIDDTTGTPSVDVSMSGPDTAKVLSFAFKHLKGAKGDTPTKADIGLGNVDNTSDLDKPISTSMQQALNGKADTATTLAGYGITDAYTKTAVDNLLTDYMKMPIQDNSGFHNSLYRGKDITSYWTDGSLWDRIQGTNGRKLFEDLYVGDWFSTGTHSINGTSANQCFMIGGFDLRLGVGATNVSKHHIVPVPCNSTGTDTRALFNSQMYAEVPFTGAYQGSIVHPLFLPDGAASTDLKAIFGSHLLQSSELISTANNSNGYGRYGSASGVSTSWAWVDVCGILMSEVEVYGSIVWSSSGYDGGMSSRGQLPLFRLRPDLISNRSWNFWLRDATSANDFALVYSGGFARDGTATVSLGVRPRFLIG